MNITEKLILADLTMELCGVGIILKKIDKENKILYLDMPKHSYGYTCDNDGIEVCNAEEYATYLKKYLKPLIPDVRIKFKERNDVIYWTKEMGEEAKKELKKYVCDNC